MAKREFIDEKEMTFLDHLEEFRWHLIRSVLAVLIFAILAFIFHRFIFDNIIIAPKSPEFFTNQMFCKVSRMMDTDKLCINSKPFNIINIKMAGQFSTHIIVSLILGIVIAFPYIFFEFWRFVRPALKSNEKTKSRGAIFFSSILFALGVLFGYFLIVPLSVHFLGSYTVSSEVSNQINLNSYISTVTSVVLASGVIFELPILVYFLSKIGMITPRFLKKYRKHSLVLILILSAIITPPDVFSQILVCLPLLVLYEIGITISRRIEKSNLKKFESKS